jgi:hypothetical protein
VSKPLQSRPFDLTVLEENLISKLKYGEQDFLSQLFFFLIGSHHLLCWLALDYINQNHL